MSHEERRIERQEYNKTIAEISFEDGTSTTIESDWSNDTRSYYDGGHWGPFPSFQKDVETRVSQAQKDWAKPAATINFFRVTKVVETIERTITSRKFYTERTVKP